MQGSHQLGRLEVTTLCSNCNSFTIATPAGENVNRCTECGCYATDEPEVCCTTHKIRESPYPSGTCPHCEQEQSRRDAIQHEMTRDPTLEPW